MTIHGPLLKLIIGLEPSLTIADCDVIESILSSTKIIEKARQYRYFINWLGYGLLTSGGTKWKQRRKIITPAYHFQILEQFVPIFDAISEILIEKLRENIDKTFDVYPYITLFALDVICETAMGTSVQAQRNKNSEYVLCVKEMCRILMDKTFSPIQQMDFLYKFTKNYRREQKCLAILNEHTLSVIRKRRDEMSLTNTAEKMDDCEPKRKVAFLDLLLQATINGKHLSDEDIREEVATFMFEGQDTTASAISFALYCISSNPSVQEKVIEEQRTIFGNDKLRKCTHRDLQDMKYLEMVIKETLRMYPTVPFFARETTEEMKINENLILPKNFTVSIFTFVVHRNPKYYPNPEVFDPERFSPEARLNKHPYSYIPFSAGPRNCIGQKFAMLEIKATLSKIMRHFEVYQDVPRHEVKLISETILKSANGIVVGIRERRWNS